MEQLFAKTLVDLLETSKRKFAKFCVFSMKPRYRTMSWTYEELYNFACGMAKLLEEQGLKKEDRAILWSPNSPYWQGAFWGCLLKGIIVVPLMVQSKPEFIQKVARKTGARILLKPSFFKKPHTISCKTIDIDLRDEFCRTPFLFQRSYIGEDDVAEILYTSGTTGDPKGVILTHKNIVSNLKSVFPLISAKSLDVSLSVLPLSHIFEQILELRALASGMKIVYIPSPASSIIFRALVENKVTKLAVVPEFLRLSLQRIEQEIRERGIEGVFNALCRISSFLPFSLRRILFWNIHKKFGGKLQMIFYGGASLDIVIAKKWQAMGFRLLQGYGLTETSPVVTITPLNSLNLKSVGKVVPGVQVKIAEDGEILVKGPNVMVGYWKDARKTRSAFEDGWFKTGDMGYFDEKGFLYLKGRKKFMILTESGQNVYPEDIEAELNKEEGVQDSCVIPLEKGGRTEIHAVLLAPYLSALQKGAGLGQIASPELLINRVNKRLASFQQIQSWSIWPFPDFPRTLTRKAKRYEVLKYIQEHIPPEEFRLNKKIVSPLVSILAEISGKPGSLIGPKTNLLRDLKFDSLMRIELVARIEEKFGIEVDEAAIGAKITVQDLEELLKEKPRKKIRHRLLAWPRFPIVKTTRAFLQYVFLFPLLSILTKIEVEGIENLRALKDIRGPIIFMANHQSGLDGLVVLKALPAFWRKSLAVATATEIIFERFPFLQFLLIPLIYLYPFQRVGQIKSSLEYTGFLIDRGYSILIFPEGRISATGKLLPLKLGAGVLAVEMGVPIVPVRISGTGRILPVHWQTRFYPRGIRGRVQVKFGKPLYFDKKTSYGEARRIIEKELHRL